MVEGLAKALVTLSEKRIVGALSVIMQAAGLILALPIPIALIYGEYQYIWCFGILALATFAAGHFVYKLVSFPPGLTVLEAMVISALGWLLMSAVGAIPYVLIINMSYLDAYFEAMSGFTTTGMTLIKVIEGTPYCLLFWRALTQWVGGAGIIMLTTLLLMGREGVIAWKLYVAEAREERIAASAKKTIKNLWEIYVFYTALCAALLMIAGMNWFDAITHSFTALATGGFSTRTLSIEAYHSPLIEGILVVFMFLGGTRFPLHYLLLKGMIRRVLHDYEFKAYLLFVAVATALITINLWSAGMFSFAESFRYSIFQVVSILTTTGYTSFDINKWPLFSQVTLLMLMIIGGCANSTGGAVKVGRIAILAKLVYREILKITLPFGAVKPLKAGDRIVGSDELARLAGFFTLYMILIAIEYLIVAIFTADGYGALSAVLSAQGNVGPCYISLFDLHPVPKAVLIFGMWVGRLELMPIAVLFLPQTWKRLREKRREEETTVSY